MTPDTINGLIPPEVLTLMITLTALSGTLFFVWGIVGPIIKRITETVHRQMYREVEIYIADPEYYKFNVWLEQNAAHTYFQRKFKIVNSAIKGEHDAIDSDDPEFANISSLVSGFGTVLVKAPGRPPVIVTRSKGEAKQIFKQTETLTFRIFSFREKPLTDLFDDIIKIKDDTGPFIYSSASSWWAKRGKPKRVLPPIGKGANEFLDDVRSFIAAKDDYVTRGIPYKRGYMLFGPPGTGKSSIIAHAAVEFGMDVFMLSSESITKFGELQPRIKPGSIVLIEDIDMSIAGISRKKLLGDKKRDPDEDEDDEKVDKITNETMRDFLNALDGICEFDGSIIVITTNKPEVLDPALLRPGRIDKHIIIDTLSPAEQIQHISGFFSCSIDAKKYSNMPYRTFAEIQFLCVSYMYDVDKVLEQLDEQQ